MGFHYVEHRRRSRRPVISVILIDWGVRESFHSLEYLNRQTLSREQYELIWIEFYDRTPQEQERLLQPGRSGSGAFLDKLVVLGHESRIHYHKHFLYNVGIVASEGSICVICDSDAVFAPTFLHSILFAFRARPRLVLHVDQVRSESRRFYPFNYPEIATILAEPRLVNWTGSTTTGLAGTTDRLHEANYGACMCATRRDLLEIGGADEHTDYLGYICGPYEMTFRLVNGGWNEHWLTHEWIYHVWHPGQAGSHDFGGPHDGRNVSLRALDLRANGRTLPWVPNDVIALAREAQDSPRDALLDHLSGQLHEEWDRTTARLTRLDPIELLEEGFREYNVIRHGSAFIALHQGEGSYVPERLLAADYRRCFCAETIADVKAAIEEGAGSPRFLGNLDSRGLASLIAAPLRQESPPTPPELPLHCSYPDDRARFGRDAIRCRLLSRLGWVHYHRRLYVEACAIFDEAIHLDGSSLEALSGRGWTSLQLGRTVDALTDFGAAVDQLPKGAHHMRAEVLRGRAWAHCYNGMFRAAVDDFDQALVAAPVSPHDRTNILRGRSRALYMMGEVTRALDDFRAVPSLRSVPRGPSLDRAVLALHAHGAVLKSQIKRMWARSTDTIEGRHHR
jgi:tetratricopeptide (TPR) repeat protein